MALEISGKLIKVQPAQSGAGKNGTWTRQDFIIESNDRFPKKVCCSAWGEVVAEMGKYKTGDELKVFFNLESREYNERWYTDVRVWKIEKTAQGSESPDVEESSADAVAGKEFEDDLPF